MAASVEPQGETGPTFCNEPHCDKAATFVVASAGKPWAFCEEHVWPRVHLWLNKLPPGRIVTVVRLRLPEPQLPG